MESIIINNQEFFLGCAERTDPLGSVSPIFGDPGTPPIITQDKWEPLIDFEAKLPPITPQGQHGSCVATNTSDLVKGVLNMMNVPIPALGAPNDISPWDLYRRICGGRDAGASISAGIKELITNGICRLRTIPSFTLSTKNPAGWAEEAAQVKINKSFDCPNVEALCSAIQYRFFVNFGMTVYSNFQQVDGDYVVPRPSGRVRGGHCVGACGLRNFRGDWQIKLATKSWGESFGDKGCVWYPTKYINESNMDSHAIQSVTYVES